MVAVGPLLDSGNCSSVIELYNDIIAGLLVGGRGRRLGGADKAALLRPDGVTFAQHIVSAVTPVVAEVVLLGRQGQRGHGLELGRPLRFMADAYDESGPLAGLERLLSASDVGWCFLVACDLPHFDVEILHRLAAARDDEAQVIVPETDDGIHPTCALYRRHLHSAATRALDNRQLAMHQFIRGVVSRRIGMQEKLSTALHNANFVDDLP